MLKRDLGSDRDHLKYLRREALDWLAVSLMGWRTPRRAGKVKLPTTSAHPGPRRCQVRRWKRCHVALRAAGWRLGSSLGGDAGGLP
jgi:hypothetical protein